MQQPDDEILLTAASRGDGEGFRQLFRRHHQAVFHFAYRLSGSESLAEDITQDCFLSLLEHPARYNRALGSLKTYLFGMVRNLFLKYLRRSGSNVNLEDSDVAVRLDGGPDPAAQALKQELGESVRKAVGMLPPLKREALVLFEYEGLALTEIAQVVGADVTAVKSRLSRARENLRSLLAPNVSNASKSSDRRSQINATN